MTLKSSFITGIPIGNTLWMKQISLSAKKENGKKNNDEGHSNHANSPVIASLIVERQLVTGLLSE